MSNMMFCSTRNQIESHQMYRKLNCTWLQLSSGSASIASSASSSSMVLSCWMIMYSRPRTATRRAATPLLNRALRSTPLGPTMYACRVTSLAALTAVAMTGMAQSSCFHAQSSMHKCQGLHLAALRDVLTATLTLIVSSACKYTLSCCDSRLTCATHCTNLHCTLPESVCHNVA